jgi:hypothetical protein
VSLLRSGKAIPVGEGRDSVKWADVLQARSRPILREAWFGQRAPWASFSEIKNMVWRIVRSKGFIPVVLIVAALLYWRLHNGPAKAISVGYVADRSVILWNTLAEVHDAVAEVHYGDRVEVLRVEGPSSQVRTASGVVGWIRDSRQIMDSELWGKSALLLERARKLPVQARGRTKAVSNVRLEPGRDASRIFQFVRGTPVVILERAVADASQASDENSQEEKGSAPDEPKPKQEDWLLVLRADDASSAGNENTSSGNSSQNSLKVNEAPKVKPASADAVSGGPSVTQPGVLAISGPAGPIAGWVLARFIEPDLPGPVKDYASSADLHVVAWFELNRVPDGSGGEAPQYLVAGTHGGEVQSCDFTMLRVYTWGKARKRYETAYVESNLCGHLPIRVSDSPKGPQFQFVEADGSNSNRIYVMQQTVVHRVKEGASPRKTKRK